MANNELENYDDGVADQVDAALADLALSAIATLRVVMASAKAPKDRLAAANSILDRLGYGRTTRLAAGNADREIRTALEAAKRAAEAEAKKELEQ